METPDLKSMIEDLRDNIDDLENALAPLLQVNLADISSKLPLLDKAKLSVLATYAIESILFSILKLNGVDAKGHPVFGELTRVKQYFQKIKEAEAGGPEKRTNMRLDNQAANRLIKHALSGNDRHDRERDERVVKEKAAARKKLESMTDPSTAEVSPDKISKKRKADVNSVQMPNASGKPLRDESGLPVAEGSSPFHEGKGSHSKKKAKKETRPKDQHSVKKKSNNPPRDSKMVFNDLLNKYATSSQAL